MPSPSISTHEYEVERINELLSFNIMDTVPEKHYDTLVKLASSMCNTPIALISLIDSERQWYKSKIGIDEKELPVQDTICRLTMQQDELLEIEDTLLHDEVCDIPFVAVDNGIRFYAGLPIETKNGHNIGTVCVADYEPKKLTAEQRGMLELITEQVLNLLEVRKKQDKITAELTGILKKKLNLADKRIVRRELEYNLLYDAVSNSGIIMNLDAKGRILKVNEFFQNTTGYTEDELLGDHYDRILSDDTVSTKHIFSELMSEEELQFGNVKIQNKAGESMWLKATFNPVFDSDGNFKGTVKVAHDITGQVQAQEKLLEAKSLSDKLNLQKDKFIANMSHEIRTPINAIIGFTELLQGLEKDKVKGDYVNSIKNAGDKLLFIVNDILDLSQIEAGNFQIDQKDFNLSKTVEDIFSMLRLAAHKKKLDFNYEISDDTPSYVIGDKNRLSQVLINLLTNAIKFTENGHVKLTVRNISPGKQLDTDKSLIEFKVSDSGIGIAKNRIDKVFDRFIQENESISSQYGGTGLGLNISKLLVEKQNGKMKLHSKKGEGSNFIFTIPFEVAESSEDKQFEITSQSQSDTSHARILLCEDNNLNQRLVEAIFSQTNYELEIAQDGNIALEKLREKEYDLVLLDIQMPHKNGYEVIREIRNDLNLIVPVIAVSAHSMIKEKKKCIKLGMNDYLSKPFNRKDLLNTINHWLTDFSNCLKHFDDEFDIKEMSRITMDRLKELSGGDKELENNILGLFIEETLSVKIEIQKAVAEKDADSLNEILHKLKSSFGLIGANITLINNFEELLEHDDIDFTEIAMCLLKQIDMLVSSVRKVYQHHS